MKKKYEIGVAWCKESRKDNLHVKSDLYVSSMELQELWTTHKKHALGMNELSSNTSSKISHWRMIINYVIFEIIYCSGYVINATVKSTFDDLISTYITQQIHFALSMMKN